MSRTPLSIFHPLINEWFNKTFGVPTDVQQKAWPEIAAGNHVLVTAPTGSGKTLTAFLWSLHQLLTGSWPNGHIRVVYISPLKALNNDVFRNLEKPLAELKEAFIESGEPFSSVRVLTRSGDTPQAERRLMHRKPPEILITTPESLNLLVSSKSGRSMLTGVTSVIMDEIHAVVSSKRGTHLMTAVDRLVPICGEFQRIALSATVKPLKKVAEFIGGYSMEGDSIEPVYKKRHVSIVRSEHEKELEIKVCFPEDASEEIQNGSRWPVLIDNFKSIILKNHSTLLFANSRRMTEKVARLINENELDVMAYSHHGSLSKEIRLVVEQKLKKGDLKAIVATNSLELGIDIGDLDQVVLIQSPPSVSSAIQRIGRSGHSVGQTSRGRLFPTHGRDFLNAAVMARCIAEQDIEETGWINCPLDVLAQVVIAMTGVETWNPDELFAFIKTSAAYHSLSRRQFDLVLEMLAGRYADIRLRELKPRISIDRVDNTIKAKQGSLMLVYLSGGTIPDRGYYNLRYQDSKAKIGELDEEFVWERNVGETFAMGTQTWRIQRITHNDIEVVPAQTRPGIIPFWKAESRNRDFHLSEKIADFLELADSNIKQKDDAFQKMLQGSYFMDEPAAIDLISFLRRQKEVTGTDLPHRHHLLVEHFEDPLNRADSKQVILHTLWGGKINRPFAMALSAAWEIKYRYPIEVFPDDDCILVILPHAFDSNVLLDLVHAGNAESLLRTRLEKTGFFGARFRENAGRALLLPRLNVKKRMPLWLNRLRSKKLMAASMQAKDFPILLETWRCCLQDEFDLENLKYLLDELAGGQIRISHCRTTSASPFAGSLIWQQTNKHMYEDDTPDSGKSSDLSSDLIREIAGSEVNRAGISENLINTLIKKFQRTAEGYAPGSETDLLDWVKERLLIPEHEWLDLLSAMERDHGPDIQSRISFCTKLVFITFPNAEVTGICSVETLPRISYLFSIEKETLCIRSIESEKKALTPGLEKIITTLFENHGQSEISEEDKEASFYEFLGQWLSYYGPLDEAVLKTTFGLSDSQLESVCESLQNMDRIVRGNFTDIMNAPQICYQENLEILLRMARKARQPEFKALPENALPLYLAAFQGLTVTGETAEELQSRIDQLFGYIAPALSWEEYIFPARLSPYSLSWLDSLIQSSDLSWFGCGDKKIGFAFREDLELFMTAPDSSEETKKNNTGIDIEKLLPDKRGRYSFFDIITYSGLNSETASEELWKLVWQGELLNDTFAVLRKGIMNKFNPSKIEGKRRGRRGHFNRWKSSRPLLGNWYAPDYGWGETDAMEEMEIQKDRVRQLLRRYGILFREILSREVSLLNWGSLFKTLRLMELSGEILSGHFFKGIQGLQFISHEAFRFLQESLPEDKVYWMNAADPASLCGIKIEGLEYDLPSRLLTNHLVFHGKELVLVSKRSCKHLDIHVSFDHPHLIRYFSFFKIILNREFNPRRSIMIETINDEEAKESPYAGKLMEFGFSKDYKGLELWRHY